MSYKQELMDRIMARDRVLISDWETWQREELPKLGRVIAGRNSYSAHIAGNHRRKYVDVLDWPVSNLELVREFLRDKIAQVPKGAGWGRGHKLYHWSELRWLDVPAPLHWVGGTVSGEYAYIDINAAFYSLYTAIGSYDPHMTSTGRMLRGWTDLDGVEMFRSDHLARNSIVGMARARRMEEYRFGERIIRNAPGRYTSPGLWSAIVWQLREIAREAVRSFGAIYVATDGYIVPAERMALFADFLGAQGLRSRVLGAGASTVTGLGSYRVGAYGSSVLRPASAAISNLAAVAVRY